MTAEMRYVVDVPVVMVPGRVASVLHEYLTPLRIDMKQRDQEVHQVLLGIAHLAIAFRARTGTMQAPQAEPPSDLSQWIGTATAATRLGISGRAVRRAIEEKRLAGWFQNGRWYVTRDDVERYLIARNYQ